MTDLFGLDGRVAIVTGGTGALGSTLAGALAEAGAAVGVLARDQKRIEVTVADIAAAGGAAFPLAGGCSRPRQLEHAREDLAVSRHGHIDVLVNAAGGNLPEATVDPDGTFFDLPTDALDAVFKLNLSGTLLACQVFGPALIPQTEEDYGRSIVNISSMAAGRALSRVAGYGAAKAAVENFTRWLAVDCRTPLRRPATRERDRTRLPRQRAEPRAAPRAGWPTDRARPRHHRPHTGRPPRRTLRPDQHPALALQPRLPLRHRHRRPVDGGFSAWSGI